MIIELSPEQKQTVYQILAQRNLENYQAEVEAVMCRTVSPMTALNVIRVLCSEVEHQTVRKMTERENQKLELINSTLTKGLGK